MMPMLSVGGGKYPSIRKIMVGIITTYLCVRVRYTRRLWQDQGWALAVYCVILATVWL